MPSSIGLLFGLRRVWLVQYTIHTPCIRRYATSKEYSSILNQQKTRAAFQNAQSVGPFMLGGVQSYGGEKVKGWKELTPTGKLARSTARTSNLLVILIGASLSALLVYALATELYAESSPTVLYGNACEMIQKSEELKRHFRGRLRFYNNPPIEGRPQHRNRGVSHHILVDSRGVEHMYINFFIDSSQLTDSPHFWEVPLNERFTSWYRKAVNMAQTLSFEDVQNSLKQYFNDVHSAFTDIFRRLTNQRVERPMKDVPTTHKSVDTAEQSRSWSSGIFGMFDGLKTRSSGRPTKQESKLWEEAEVHADLIRSQDGKYQWRYLVVDIPSSRHPNPQRIFIQKAPDVRHNEAVMMWQ